MMDDFACPVVDKPRASLQISVIAYECLPGAVFVRVPNERGRWLMTDRCVVEVDCVVCGALCGEPCHNNKQGALRHYNVGTHARRRDHGVMRHRQMAPKPKLRMRAEDWMELDVPVTMKAKPSSGGGKDG